MDLIAARAETSKRTLYAHFENKENLYLAVVDLVRSLFVARLETPADYPGTVAEKLASFCGRYLETLLHDRAVLMCRLSMAEAARFPEGAAQYFEVVFTTPRDLLSAYLKTTFKLSQSQRRNRRRPHRPHPPPALLPRAVRRRPALQAVRPQAHPQGRHQCPKIAGRASEQASKR